MYTFTVLLAVVSLLASSFVDGEDNSHGFGDDLPWVKWENARDVAKMQRKPIMLIIHKSWCGACQCG
jgi:protein-disulfide reductase (glutathione)